MYTPGIIPPKLPSTPTTDSTDEIAEREPFDRPHNFRHTPDPYIRDSRDNNEGDEEDSDTMSEIRPHNRYGSDKLKAKVRDYGTQSEIKSTRNVGTMSEPIKTRNYGNEAQPQSSATQTLGLQQQQQQQLPYNVIQQDETDLRQPTSQRSRHDSRTNGYHPSQRSTSLNYPDRYMFSSPKSQRRIDYSDYDERQTPHLSQYNDDPRGQQISTRNDYEHSTIHRPHSSSQTQQHIPSSTTLHRTPSPPVEHRTRSSNDRYRTHSPPDQHRFIQPQRSRSPSPPIQKDTSTSTSRQRTVSPPSQRRSRPSQRSPSPPTSRHHTSSSTKLHRTPSPPTGYRSRSPKDRHRSPLSSSKNYSRKTKDRPQMISAETDTSLDGMRPQQHRGVQSETPSTRDYGITSNAENKYPPQTSHSTNLNTRSSYSQYQTFNSSLPKRQDYITISPNENNYKSLRDDQPPSTRKNYRLRPVQHDSYADNYEEISSKHDESMSPEYNHTFDRPKEYTSKPFTGDRRQQTSPTVQHRSNEEVQHATLSFTDDDIPNDQYIRELARGDSISIQSTTVIQPDTLPRSYGQNKSPTHQKYDRVDNRGKLAELPLHHGHQRRTSIDDSPVLNIGTEKIIHQSPDNESAIPFEIRYVHDHGYDFKTNNNNNNIRSSTLKRDDLRSKNSRTLLLPVLNSSRTYVFEKQSLPGNYVRQSRINGNFYLAASPTLHSLNSSFPVDDPEIDSLTKTIDSTNLHGHELRSQVA